MAYKMDTKCIINNLVQAKSDKTKSLSMPIYQTATYAHHGLGNSSGYDYSRLQNPTREVLEAVVRDLEGGIDALAFSSGMAAISTLFELLLPDDHLIVSDDLYGGTVRFFESILKARNIHITYVDTTNKNSVIYAITKKTKAIFIETPTNPLMRITDIKSISDIAKSHGLLTIVDNTFLTPYFQNPLKLGADVVVHSGTKYLAGHNDTVAGFLVTNSESISKKLRYISKTIGNNLAPFDAWLVIRGIKTLAIRMKQSESNAKEIVKFLQSHPKVSKVYYPGLAHSPFYEIQKNQSTGFGAMISFEVDTFETAKNLLETTRVIAFAESLGGVESLMTYPITQTHADVDPNTLKKLGINDKFLRLSVGIEHIDDLILDLKEGLNSHE